MRPWKRRHRRGGKRALPWRAAETAVAVAAALVAAPAAAAGPTDGGAQGEAPPKPPDVPPPPGLGSKQRLRDDDYARKEEGGYFTGLPFANYDPTTLFGFGGRLYYYWNGDRTDRRFAYTPYLHRVIAQVFLSTAGAQDQMLDYDAPLFLGSLYRVRATLEYEAATAWPYYGVGARTMGPLTFPGNPGVAYGNASDFDRATHAVSPDGKTYGSYNLFGIERPTLQIGIERLFFGGVLRPFFGFGFSHNQLTDMTGRPSSATGPDGKATTAPEGQTLLAADCAAKRIVGCEGGFDNVMRLALSVDTRDLEPDPNSGIYAEFSTELGNKALGSRYNYVRTMLSVRGFYSPIPKIADVVLAARGVYEMQTSGAPFFSMPEMPFIDDNHAGLGGFRTMRGFAQNRFVGPVMVLTNFEVRYTFYKFHLLKQGLALIGVPFLDMGRVFDNVKDTSFVGWKRSQGVGLRIGWNEATVVMMDYGFSEEGSGLYINFNHIF